MQKKLTARASDLGPLLTSGAMGFTKRKRSGVSMFMHFFLLGGLIFLGSVMLIEYGSRQGCLLVASIGAIFTFISYHHEKLKKAKHSLEFMNALFSAALGRGYKFSAVVKSTGELVFFNRPFQILFPAYITQSDRKITALFEAYNVPQADRDKIDQLMNSGSEGTVSTSLRESSATSELAITLHIEPIERPTGFFLLRGK